MKHLKELEKEHKAYANTIETFIAQPRTNGQLIDLIKQTTSYLRYASEELHTYNEYINKFIGTLTKLP